MSTPVGRSARRPERVVLTRERVLEAALGEIDRHGLEALSMRKLGAALGVEAMSLYNHVQNKEDVLDGVVELLWREVDAQLTGTGGWPEQARAFAAAVRHTAHAHPGAYPLVLTRGVLPTDLIRIGRRLLTALQDAGFDDLAPRAMLTLASHATSQALAEITWHGERASERSAGDLAEWPRVVGVHRQLPQHDTDTPFTLGLELLIEALDARLARRRRDPGR